MIVLGFVKESISFSLKYDGVLSASSNITRGVVEKQVHAEKVEELD